MIEPYSLINALLSLDLLSRSQPKFLLLLVPGQGQSTHTKKNIIISTMAQHGGDHSTTNEFDALANDLENMMNSANLTMSPRCCIFKVPKILSRHNPSAYAPNAFSIGPYHYGEEHLKVTQKIKLRYLHDLISSFPDSKAMLRTLVGAISEVKQEARDCYADSFDHISMDEFIKIMVLDGCFLIELFRKDACKDLQKADDPVFMMSCMRQFLCHDIALLENQIPWLVLELLFDVTKKPAQTLPLSVLVQCWGYSSLCYEVHFRPYLSREHEGKHVLDLMRNSLVVSSSMTRERTLEWQSMPSATRLREAGIKFKKGTLSTSILDIKFEDGVLEIPQLVIHEDTESLFRNLICLEQCLPNCAPIVTSYAVLLDNLINTTGDMEILCKSGIIQNWLNIDDATEFFNQLYNDTSVKEVYYFHLVAEVNKYCQRRWPRYRAVLMHDYLQHPWALASVVAAAILLIFTFLETLFTILN